MSGRRRDGGSGFLPDERAIAGRNDGRIFLGEPVSASALMGGTASGSATIARSAHQTIPASARGRGTLQS